MDYKALEYSFLEENEKEEIIKGINNALKKISDKNGFGIYNRTDNSITDVCGLFHDALLIELAPTIKTSNETYFLLLNKRKDIYYLVFEFVKKYFPLVSITDADKKHLEYLMRDKKETKNYLYF